MNANGTSTAVSFDSGTSAAYGTSVAATPSPVTGISDTPVTAVLGGLSPGTTYHFRVTATNATGTATASDVTFTTLSTDADLTGLTPGAGTLTPAFARSTTAYTAGVANATATVTFTPVASNANAVTRIRVNGGAFVTVASGTASVPLPLNVGINPVDIRVTAQDGVTVKTYSVALTRRSRYEDWALSQGVTGPNSGPTDDFDGDGISKSSASRIRRCSLDRLTASSMCV